MDYTIKIGGEAGQGIQTIGETLARVFSRTRHHVVSHQDYESRIRGGHNFYKIRLSDRHISAPRDNVDILVALDRESILQHERDLTSGRTIYDSSSLKLKYEKPPFLDIPFADLAIENGGEHIMANTVATGAVLGMLGMELTHFLDIMPLPSGKKAMKWKWQTRARRSQATNSPSSIAGDVPSPLGLSMLSPGC
jgi:2-oxoglutarate ferredoxin oxidoreductase subunit alpha